MSNNREYWNRMAYTSTASTYSIERSPLSELREIKVELNDPPKKKEIPKKNKEMLFDPKELDL